MLPGIAELHPPGPGRQEHPGRGGQHLQSGRLWAGQAHQGGSPGRQGASSPVLRAADSWGLPEQGQGAEGCFRAGGAVGNHRRKGRCPGPLPSGWPGVQGGAGAQPSCAHSLSLPPSGGRPGRRLGVVCELRANISPRLPVPSERERHMRTVCSGPPSPCRGPSLPVTQTPARGMYTPYP